MQQHQHQQYGMIVQEQTLLISGLVDGLLQMKIIILDIEKTRNGIGDVWINMKKLLSKGREFDVTTHTAVAAIRGTIFQMKSEADSTAEVSVFDGKVAVGPSDELKKKTRQAKPAEQMEKPVEVPGPEEIPGPFEVSLEQWRDIVAGQKIDVRPDGKFKQEKFDLAAAAMGKFVKKNEALDKEMAGEK